MESSKRLRISPSLKIVLGFMGIILIGTFLISLPWSNTTGTWLNFVDSLFTSTSAVCVTGLIVVDTATQFTLFGKIILLLLIQIGGLGIIAVTSLIFLILGKKINLSNRMTIRESLNKENLQGCVKFIKRVLIITFSIELVGVIMLLYGMISYTGSFWSGLFNAIFMSVSAFCNAGFDILGTSGQEFVSLYAFSSKVLVILPLLFLIVLGGIGFIVLIEGFKNFKNKQHTKVVLLITFILLFGGAIMFLIMEWNNPATLGNMSVSDKIFNALFQSSTTRTAGFATIDQASMTTGSQILSMILMFIGGSPNSCAGGIKTTTFFIFILFLVKRANVNGDIRLKNRKISRAILFKAIKLISYAMLFIVASVILIGVIEGNAFSLDSVLFECISAISTVGLTFGITPFLSGFSKIILILLMFVGRVGLTTITLSLSSKITSEANVQIDYPNTDIIVG